MTVAVPPTEPAALATPSTASILGSRLAGTGWRSALETEATPWTCTATPASTLANRLVEGLVDGVAQHEGAADEAHPEDDRERDQHEPQRARAQVARGQPPDHRAAARRRLHAIEDRRRGRRRQVADDLAVRQEHDLVGVAGRVGVVGHHHDRLGELVDGAAHERQQLGRGMRVQLARRLVGEHDRRMAGERPGRGDPLLLAAGELARPVAQAIAEFERADHLVEPFLVGAGARRCPAAGGCSRARSASAAG